MDQIYLACLFGVEHPQVIDLGYAISPDAQVRFDLLRQAGLGKANFKIVGHGRLVARMPPAKRDALLAAFPEIKYRRGGYASCNYAWLTDASEDFARWWKMICLQKAGVLCP